MSGLRGEVLELLAPFREPMRGMSARDIARGLRHDGPELRPSLQARIASVRAALGELEREGLASGRVVKAGGPVRWVRS